MAKTYDSYKDSGIAWIGEIPSEWKMVDAKRILKNEKKVVGKESENYDRLALTLNGVIKRSKDDSEGLQPEKFESYQILGINDLVFKLIDLQNISTSRVGLSPYEGLVSPAYIVVKNRKGNDNKFYYYWYMNMYYTHVFNNIGGDGVRSAINAQDLLSLKIPNISLDKQRAIASFLDKKCGEIDSLISLQEEMISELQAYKQSVITEAVTKGLDPNAKMNCCASREKNDACISSSETQPAIERKFKDSGVEWIGAIPAGRNLSRAKFLVEITHGTDPKTDGDIPVYGSGAGSFKTCGEYKEGDAVLIGRKGATLNIPHYIVGKYWNVDTAFDVKAKNCFSLRYYYYLAFCFDYKKYMSQTTLPGMTQSDYNNMTLPFPPLNIQKSIATYLDSKTSQIDSLISLKQQKIDELKSYKKSIIYEYVTGKKRV